MNISRSLFDCIFSFLKFNMGMLQAYKRWNVFELLLFTAGLIFVTGCGTTLSPVKRTPVQISKIETSLPSNDQKMLVQFERTLPGTPLTETVWDNASGAFADVSESKQIGFTQNYKKSIPATAVASAVGGVVAGGVVYGVIATRPHYTRIVIPFGRIFEGVFQSGLQKAFPNSQTSLNESAALPLTTQSSVVSLKVVEYQVWEEPLNHINMRAVFECKVYQSAITSQPAFVFEVRQEKTEQSIGSVMTTSSGFIKKMNKITNDFAASLSEEILGKLQGYFNQPAQANRK